MWIAALAAAGALMLVVVGVGGWLLLKPGDRDGAANPELAVHAFLQAVYRDGDPGAAAGLVCSEARDERALAAKIDELHTYQESQVEPRFHWNVREVVEQSDELATVAVTITLTTGDEQVADQTLHVQVLDKGKHGWWVCDITTVAPEPTEPEPTAEPAGDEPAGDDSTDSAGDEPAGDDSTDSAGDEPAGDDSADSA